MGVEQDYKRTEVGTIPKDWDVVTLGDIGDCLIGLTYRPEDVTADGTLVLRSSNISDDGRLTLDDNVYVDVAIPPRLIVQEDDILICVRNGSRDLIGKCVLLDARAPGMTFGAFMSVFRTPHARFVIHLLRSDLIKRQIDQHLGATINQITNKSLKSFRIPFPRSEGERLAIAATLNDVDALIESLEHLIAKKRIIRHGAADELMTGRKRLPGFSGPWVARKLGELGYTYGGLTGKAKSDFGSGSARYIPFMNVMSNVIIDTRYLEPVRVSPSESQNEVRAGDLFFNASSETPEEVGMCSVLLHDVNSVYLNSFCFGFRCYEEARVNGLYLAYYFRSPLGRKLMYSLAQGATRYNLSKAHLLEVQIQLPPPEEQEAIATVLREMDDEIAALEAKLAKVRQIKRGMAQQLLSGKIRLVSVL